MGYLDVLGALQTSLVLAFSTGVVATALGALTANAIVRHDFRFSSVLEGIFMSPLIYPWVVIGLSILLFIDTVDAVFGITITLSFWTLLAGHVLFTLPYPIRTVGASLQNYNYSIEEAAQNLGASELETVWHVTLPMIRPGLVSGFVFVMVLSFNQYIISLFLSDIQTTTMPLLLFNLFYNTTPAQLAAIATLLMSGILLVVFVTEKTVSISEFL
jgi:ABC-type spermidine/putrescine transport system permease subunit II